jgi:hypothetical protein
MQATDHAGQQPQAIDLAFLGSLEQQLHAQADAHQRHLQGTQRLDQALRVQPAHAFGRCTNAGQDHPRQSFQVIGGAYHAQLLPQSLQRITHRTEVGTAGIDQADRAHNAPLVEGSSVPSRRMAWRRARANALKQASTLW